MTVSNKPGELITVVCGLCRMPFILAQIKRTRALKEGAVPVPPPSAL